MTPDLFIPAFISGLLMFFAPCTLPLVPGFLAFISGVPLQVIHGSHTPARAIRWKIFQNALWYVIGFSTVFITLGVVFGLGGAALIEYRIWLMRAGGLFVILFGLYLLGFSKLKFLRFLSSEHRLHPSRFLKPGHASSSFIFGATFAFGWSPCVGPVLGSILFLAWSSGTVLQGAFLLTIFSIGLAIPFLFLALTIATATQRLKRIYKYLPMISWVGGVFLVLLGVLLVFDQVGIWTAAAYRWLNILHYDRLLDYL